MKSFTVTFLLMFAFQLILRAQNEGPFWSPVNIPPNKEQYSILRGYQIAINSKDVMLLSVNYTNGKSLVFRSSDKAKTWKAIPSVVPVNKDLMPGLKMEWSISQIIAVDSVFFAVALERSVGHMVFDHNKIVRSFDGGNTWKILEDTISNKVFLLPQQNGSFLRVEGSMPHYLYQQEKWRGVFQCDNYGSKSTKIYESACDTSVIIHNGMGPIFIEAIPATSSSFFKTRNIFWAKKGSSTLQSSEVSSLYFPERCSWFQDVRNPEDVEFTVFDQLFVQQGVKKSLFGFDRNNRILKSTDDGKNWLDITNGSLRRINQLFPVPCSGNLYILGHPITQKESPKLSVQEHINNISRNKQPEFVNSSFRSKDGGKTWEELKGLSSDIIDWDYGKDGTIYVCTSKGVYKSKEKECPVNSKLVEEPKIIYGTTVITHGTLFLSPVALTFQTKIEQMADTILAKAKNGTIWHYQEESGEFKKIKTLGQSGKEKGEQILIFDWINECAIKGPGYTGAAAEALYLALTKLNKDQFNLKDIHFIGHGRGCIVNSLTVEKLLQRQPKGNVSIDQVTHIGPYERDFDINDEHPEIQAIKWPEATFPNNGVIAWDGHYTDSYWQDNGKIIAYPIAKFVVPELLKVFLEKFDKIFPEGSPKGIKYIPVTHKLEELAKKIEKDSNLDSWKVYADAIVDIMGQIDQDDVKILAKTLGYAFKILDIFSLYEEIVNSSFDSRPVLGAENFKWSDFNSKKVMDNSSYDPLFKNIGILDVYIESIRNAMPGSLVPNGGFSLSRLNGGGKYRNTGQDISSRKQGISSFDYYNNLKYSNPTENLNIDRIKGIHNGSFDRVYSPGFSFDLEQASGWKRVEQPGLETTIQLPVQFETFDFIQEKLRMMHHPELNKEPIIIRHSRFYIPTTATHLSFMMACFELKKGEVEVQIQPVGAIAPGNNIIKVHFDVIETADFQNKLIDISSLKGKVVTLEIRFGNTERKEGSLSFPMLAIDEVKFKKDIGSSTPTITPKTPTQSSNRIEAATISNKSEVLSRIVNGTTYFTNSSLNFEVKSKVLTLPESTNLTTKITFPFLITSGGGGMEELQFTWGEKIMVYSKALNQYGIAMISTDFIDVKWENGGNGAISTRYNVSR